MTIKTAAHTPGPWNVDVANRDLTSFADGAPSYRKWLYEIINAPSDINAGSEHNANAKLIEAAPDLYEAVNLLRQEIATCPNRIAGCDHQSCAAVTIAEAALAKARWGRRSTLHGFRDYDPALHGVGNVGPAGES